MSELFDAGELYEPEGEDNPFLGLDGFDKFTSEPDPYNLIEQDVMNAFGVESFDSILLDASERQIENMRGNRFESLQEAIIYLFDAGILQFSGVVVGEDEIEIEIDKDSGGRSKK